MNQKFQKIYFLFIPLLATCFAISSYSIELAHTKKQTSWLFAPGIHSSERAAAKYCEQYEASTGQLVQTPNAFTVISSKISGVNFSEIILNANSQAIPQLKIQAFKSPSILLGYLYNKIAMWRSRSNDRKEQIYIEKKEENSLEIYQPAINLKKINFGQEPDIETISQAYNQHMKKFDNAEIIMYGVSRGGAATFNFLATEYPQQNEQKVKVAVLESCFDSVRNVLFYKYPSLQKFPKAVALIEKLFSSIYSGHDLDGIAPINQVKSFPKDLPLLLITSKKDNIVPSACTWNLYHALKDAGHMHVYILELKHSSHPRYMMDHEEDTTAYETTVHAFYKKYGASYNSELAKQGKELLNTCQT